MALRKYIISSDTNLTKDLSMQQKNVFFYNSQQKINVHENYNKRENLSWNENFVWQKQTLLEN